MASRRCRERGEIPLDLMLLLVLVAAVAGALFWTLRDSLFYAALIVVFALAAIVWAFARRIRRHDEVSADRQRKVGHDGSWTSGREDE